MNESYIRNVIEAALLAAGKPLQPAELAQLFDETARPQVQDIQSALDALHAEYANRGIEIKETAAGFRIQVRREVANEISRLWPERPARYSRALLETLALIAYRQPITRAEIEAVRGVAVNPNIIKTILERNWVRVVGHRDVPGRPELLGTTRDFLDYFGLKSLDELPPLAQIKALGEIKVQFDLPDPGALGLLPGGEGDAAASGSDASAAAAPAADGEAVGATDVAAASGEAGAADQAADAGEGGVTDDATAVGDHAGAHGQADAVTSAEAHEVEGDVAGGEAHEAADVVAGAEVHGAMDVVAGAESHGATGVVAGGEAHAATGVVAGGEAHAVTDVVAGAEAHGVADVVASGEAHRAADGVSTSTVAEGGITQATDEDDEDKSADGQSTEGHEGQATGTKGGRHADSALREAEEFAASIDAELAAGDDDGSDDGSEDDELSAAGPNSSELVAGPRDIDD